MNHFSRLCLTLSKISAIVFGAYFITITSAYSSTASLSEGNKRICFLPENNTIQLCNVGLPGFDIKSLQNNRNYISSKDRDVIQGVKNNSISNARLDNSILYNYIQIPDKDTDFGSYIFSLFALLTSILIPIWQRKGQRRDAVTQKKEAINDGFWMREVIMPQINNNVFNCCAAFRARLNLSSSDFTQAYNEVLLPSLNELRDSFSLLSAFTEASSYALSLNEICDDFDDNVMDNIDSPLSTRKEDVSNLQIKLTKQLIEIHKAIS